MSAPGFIADLTNADPKAGAVVRRMYAILIDSDDDVRAWPVLERFGFWWYHGGTYYGSDKVDAVACVLAAQALAREIPNFAESVRAVRMLRIDEFSDLMPLVRQTAGN